METSLEIISERYEDISPLVYQRFFTRFPEANELFGGSVGEMSKGRMIIDLLMELMSLAENRLGSYSSER